MTIQHMTSAQYRATWSEADFQAAVIDLARANGWTVAHFRTAKVGNSWQTPVSADGAGFPDLVLASPAHGRVWFVELKRESGRLSKPQKAWMDTLERSGALTGVWRPSDWPYIVAALTHPRTTATKEKLLSATPESVKRDLSSARMVLASANTDHERVEAQRSVDNCLFWLKLHVEANPS